MTSIGLRPALLFFSLTGVNTAASISARKLSNGTTRAIISSGSPFAEIAASRRSASKNPNCPIVPTLANLVVTSQTRTNSRRSLFFEVPYILSAYRILLRRRTAVARRAPPTKRRSVPAVRIRLSCHVGWAQPHQSVHANPERKPSTINREPLRGDRRPRRSVNWQPTPPSIHRRKAPCLRHKGNSGRNLCLVVVRLTQNVAVAPYGLNIVLATRRSGELLA